MPEAHDDRPPMTTRQYREQRNAVRQARADELHRVDDPIRDRLALVLHSEDCGWNCPGHGILQPVKDRQYGRLADTALRTLIAAGRLLPDGGGTRTEWGFAWPGDFVDESPSEAVARAAAKVRRPRATVYRREVGPWVEVTDAAG
jgi:hypothetical protein